MDDPIHELLLRLAGRVDDDLLADARELVAVGEDGHALELVTAALAADATPLPPAVRDELVNAAAAARIDLDADAVLAPAAPDTTVHRFSATADADVPVVAAARELPNRLRDGVRLRLSWRQTPAGPVPTPLPQPVLLVETAADGRPGEVLAYQVGAAMARSGVHVAVEVLTSGRPLTSYHAAALRDSTPLSGDAPPRAASPPEKVESVVAEVVEQVTASHRGAPPEAPTGPVDLFAVEDEPALRPVPMRTWQSGRRRRGFGEQVAEVEVDDDLPHADDHEPLPSPVPLARRTRPRPVGEVVEQPDPLLGPIPDEGSWTDEWASGDWAVAEADADDAPVPGPATEAVPSANNAGGLTSAGGSTADRRSGAADPHSAAAAPNGTITGPHRIITGPHNASGNNTNAGPFAGPRGADTGPATPSAGLRSTTPGPYNPSARPAGPFAGPGGADTGPATPSAGLRRTTPGPYNPSARPAGPAAGPPAGSSGVAEEAQPADPTAEPDDDTPVGSHALFTDQTPQARDTPTEPHRTAAAPVEAMPPGQPEPAPDRPTGNGPAHALAEPPTGPLPVVSGPMAEALLKPEALARLSDADRELLTRLQAELAGGGPNGSPGPNGAAPA